MVDCSSQNRKKSISIFLNLKYLPYLKILTKKKLTLQSNREKIRTPRDGGSWIWTSADLLYKLCGTEKPPLLTTQTWPPTVLPNLQYPFQSSTTS